MSDTNKQPQHTPGPWRFVPRENVEPFGGAWVDSGRWAYELGDMEQDEADARLIAAAPELLEAAQTALRCGVPGTDFGDTENDPDDFRDTAELLRAAIAKATGVES